MPNTITDSKGFKPLSIKKDRIHKLSDNDLKVLFFESARNAILEIFIPTNGNNYDELSSEYAENFALIFTEKFVPKFDEYIQKKIAEAVSQANNATKTKSDTSK